MKEKIGNIISVMGFILMIASFVIYNHHIMTELVYAGFSMILIVAGIMVAADDKTEKHTR